MAYGADREAFADAVEKGYLPEQRARSCKMEYGEMNFAFQKLFVPAIDDELWKQVMSKKWLPDPDILLFRMTGPGLQSATPIPQSATPIPRNADTTSDQK
jgi:Putative metallopeptidase